MSARFFTEISELLTLQPAAVKDGRRVVEADLGLIQDAVILESQGKITWIGRRAEFEKSGVKLPAGGQTVSLRGRSVLPGFVECHTHLVYAGSRAHEFEWRMQGQTYQEIAAKGGGIRSTVEATRKATLQELTSLAQTRADRFLRQGVTTLEVKSGYGLELESEIRSLQVARALKGPRVVTTFLGAHARPAEFENLDRYVAELCDRILPPVAKDRLADRVDIYIEKGFFTPEQARRYLKRAQELGLAVTAHVEQLSEFGGTDTVLEFAPQSLDHLVYASDAQIEKIAKSPSTAVLLPTSDLYLKMDYPPARRLIDRGARVALSTDLNPGTSPTQDLSLVGVLARLQMAMTLPEVLSAYTVGAAHALGLADQCGSLQVGKNCDFNVLSGGWRELFYSVGEHPIAEVYRAGQRLI